MLMLSVPFCCHSALHELGQTNSHPPQVYPPPTYTYSLTGLTPCGPACADAANRLDVFVSYFFVTLMVS